MKVEAKDLQPGDMRTHGGRVESLEICRSNRNKIHVNQEDCYDAHQVVDVARRR